METHETAAELLKRLPPLPPRLAARPVDRRGYPVPWFVHWPEGGEPDFRVVDPAKIADAIKFSRCWVCGQERGRNVSFVVGPMCAINKTSSEPPCHLECAVWSAMACPFLTQPKMHRRENDLPAGGEMSPYGAKRNPGVTLVWTCREFKLFSDPEGRPLVHMGDPTGVLWFARGRAATRAEALESIESGCPFIRNFAEQEGEAALAEFDRRKALVVDTLVPAA